MGTSNTHFSCDGTGKGLPNIIEMPIAISITAGGIKIAMTYHKGLQRNFLKPPSNFFTPSFPSISAAIINPAIEELAAAINPKNPAPKSIIGMVKPNPIK